MADTPSRMFGLVCVLILLWVGVYWLYEPHSAARPADITLDPRPAEAPPVIAPAPEPPPPKPEPTPAPAVPTPSIPRTRVIAPEYRSYVVQRGDVSFEAIAQRLFHDRKKWELIARSNPFVTSDRLKPGRTVLNIPVDPDNIQGRLVSAPGNDAPQPDPAVPAAPETTYVVQADDTLWGIAKKVYKKGGAWKTIYDANRDVIKNPDRPPAGAVLKIPPKPE